ncbi:MAG: hypothetical protein ABFC21_04130 [Rectinema sp.]
MFHAKRLSEAALRDPCLLSKYPVNPYHKSSLYFPPGKSLSQSYRSWWRQLDISNLSVSLRDAVWRLIIIFYPGGFL